MSDSDESDAEQQKLLEAVDTGFLSNQLYQSSTENETKTPVRDAPKSQRFLDLSEGSHFSDLCVPEQMQQFVGRKLSEIIEKQLEFVDPAELGLKIPKQEAAKSRVRLLRGCDTPIEDNPQAEVIVQKRPKIQRRIIEEDQTTAEERLLAASLDGDFIYSGKEVQSWTEAANGRKLFRFKAGKDGKLHFIEPENEFYKLRKKNCWTEKRIAKNPTKGKKN